MSSAVDGANPLVGSSIHLGISLKTISIADLNGMPKCVSCLFPVCIVGKKECTGDSIRAFLSLLPGASGSDELCYYPVSSRPAAPAPYPAFAAPLGSCRKIPSIAPPWRSSCRTCSCSVSHYPTEYQVLTVCFSLV